MANEFVIKNGFISQGDSLVNAILSANTIQILTAPTLNNSNTQILSRNSSTGAIEFLTLSAVTFYVTGGTFSSNTLTLNRQNGSVSVTGFTSFNLGSFGLSLSNGSNTITTGQKGYVKIPYPGTITSWTIMTNSIGSITVDVWKDVEANFPPTSADTITNGNYAYLSNQLINSDSVLSGWTTNFLTGDIFTFNVLSATSVTNINLTINVTKT